MHTLADIEYYIVHEATKEIPKEETKSDAEKRILWINVGLAAFFIFMTGGISFGFPAMKPAILHSKVYEWLCEPHENKPCVNQTLRVNLIVQVMSAFCSLSGFILGMILDLFGRRTLSFLSAALWTVSGIVFGLSSQGFDLFIPAFTLYGIAGIGQWIAFLSYAQDFPEKRGLINGLITSTFKFDINLQLFILVWAVFGIPWMIFSLKMTPQKKHDSQVENKFTDSKLEKVKSFLKSLIPKEIFSFTMLWAIFTHSIQLVASNLYFSTVLEQAKWVSGDEATALKMNNVFSILLSIVGVFTCSFFGFLSDYIGIYVSFVIVNCMAGVWILCSSIPVVELQYIAYVAFLGWRLLMELIMSNWIFMTYPSNVTGRLYSICLTVGGVISIFFTPFINFVIEKYLKSYFIVNLTIGFFNFGSTAIFILMIVYQAKKKPAPVAVVNETEL